MNQSRLESDIRTTTLHVAGMSCGVCVRHVTRAIEGMRGVIHVDVDLGRSEALVEHLLSLVDGSALAAAVRDVGYPARVTAAIDDSDGSPTEVRKVTSGGCGCCAGAASDVNDSTTIR